MAVNGISARALTLKAHLGAARHADAMPILYFALFKGDPMGSGVEPTSTGGYARAAVNNDAALWGTLSAGQTSVQNVGVILWPVASGLYSIGATPLDYWAVFDNAAGGNLWYSGRLSSPITVTGANDQPRIPAGSLTMFTTAG